MAQYKCVPVGSLVATAKNFTLETGANTYQNIINQQASAGWELVTIYPVTLNKKSGCLASIFGKGDASATFDMLVFKIG
ncbi:MAG: DUF4177 domain-containing protein [Clostridiales bacterium]|nr:DUF4177 domain-containing protein [Clostridiales bacterium]